jgi:simple sugar transport system ATP-binding protein
MADNGLAVQLKNISKQYPGGRKKANNNVSLDLKKGEILCIAGENGAGKTTLMKILCGMETPDTGETFINGKRQEISCPLYAKNLGIGMVHQHFLLFPDYTVAENIVMGIEPRKWGVFIDGGKSKETADKIINDNNFEINSGQRVRDLTLGQMQQVEICRLLNRDAQIVILDEPTSILTEQETDSLFNTLKNLASNGKSIILITHKLREIKKICDRVVVMRRGEIAGSFNTAEADENEIARLIMGESDSAIKEARKPRETNSEKPLFGKEPVITFENVSVFRRGQKRPLLDNVSFKAASGEVLGFAGVGGNGLGVIEAVLGGFLHPAKGKIFHKGKDISFFNNYALRKEGLAYVPADRVKTGSAREAAIEENLIINRRRDFTSGAFISKKETGVFLKKLAAEYNIENAKGNEKCSTLSGGNLQKLILAREIDCLKDYIVFSEPSWGLDIASSGFIREEIDKLRKNGAAVILISTDLDEVVSLSDRIIVMYRGRAAAEMINTKDNDIKERIGRYMQGLAEQ